MAKAKTKECKVLFNTLVQRMRAKGDEEPEMKPLYIIDEILKFTFKQSKKERFYDLGDNKFCFLESLNVLDKNPDEPVLITGLFKSARNEFRPDLINKKTGAERKNPKELAEGDIEKTHFVIKIDKSAKEVYLFCEYNFHGITVRNIIAYLIEFNNRFLEFKSLKKTYSIRHLVIPRNDFLTELDTLERTKTVEIFFDKKLLGSEALNFSNRFVTLKKDLKLVASATLGHSIKGVAIDCYNALSRPGDDVSKVRVYGTDQDSNQIILDTSFMSKAEFVEIAINEETGELNTNQLFNELKKIANTF